MISVLFETTLDQLGSITSNLTDKHKTRRYSNDSEIGFQKATFNPEKDYVQLDFYANSTFGGSSNAPRQKRARGQSPNKYTMSIRFYKAKGLLPGNWAKTSVKQRVSALRTIVDSCDVKFYSSDSSFFYQGAWENLDARGLSIYQFPGPRGTGQWASVHKSSGGLSDGVYITKHLSQLIDELEDYLPQAAKALEIGTQGSSGTSDVEKNRVEADAASEEPTRNEEDLENEEDEPVQEEPEIEEPDDNEDVLADEEMQNTIRKFHKMYDSIIRVARRSDRSSPLRSAG